VCVSGRLIWLGSILTHSLQVLLAWSLDHEVSIIWELLRKAIHEVPEHTHSLRNSKGGAAKYAVTDPPYLKTTTLESSQRLVLWQYLLYGVIMCWNFVVITSTKYPAKSQGLISVIIEDSGINFCDEYCSVIWFYAFMKIRFANGIRSTNKGNAHLFVSLNLHPNNE
jgi:hypothetical protein